MQSITDYPLISRGLQESESLDAVLGYTVKSLEQTLALPEYAVTEPHRFDSKKERQIVAGVEKLTGYGFKLSNMFEDMCRELRRVPTQAEFNAESLQYVAETWHDNPSNTECIEWSDTVEKAVVNRNLRTYIAQVNEFHFMLLVQELFPEWSVYNSNELDIIMGVDAVIETDCKRLYFHIYKNSPYSFKAYRLKEKRGGRRNAEGQFIRYNRDFSGHNSLMYEGRITVSSETTKFINGLPLFKPEWLKAQLTMYNRFNQFGEELKASSKLQSLEEFLQLTEKQEESENE